MKWRVEGRWSGWAVAMLLGCGDGVQKVEPVDCDPIADTGCPAGTHCRVLLGGERACLAQEEAIEAQCSAASCPTGEACLVVEGRAGCHPICAEQGGACGADGLCAYAIEGAAWSACLEPCALGSCPAGSTCAPVDLPFPICVGVGEAVLGEPCAEARCAAGLACLLSDDVPRCMQLCRPGMHADCDDGQCVGVIRDQPTVQFCEGEGP